MNSMNKDPKNREEEDEQQVDTVAREVVEQLDAYKDYQREVRGDSLNFGDY